MAGFSKGIKQGFYEPEFPEKWIITETFDVKGNAIKYRSSWELKFCKFADFNPQILKVNSEGVVIPYLNPAKNKMAKYYMDFMIQTKKGVFLVEVKPYSQTIPPNLPRVRNDKSMKNYQRALETYIVNKAKWEAAEKFAEEGNMTFIIITERELGL